MNSKHIIVAAVGLAVLASPATVLAQKSKDTLRHIHFGSFSVVDSIYDPRPESAFVSEGTYDKLVTFNSKSGKYEGQLAESWTRPDAKTLEFTLRDGVRWSDGEKFDADDVVYTFNFFINPKVRFRFKRNFAFIAKVEKLGPLKVRITAKKPTPFDLARLSGAAFVYPQHVHGPLKNKRDFGKKPVGTGPYRVAQVDKNRGVVLIKKDTYDLASAAKPAGSIGRIHMRAVDDRGAQIAELLAGNVDAVKDIPVDQAEQLGKNPNFGVSTQLNFSYQYLLIDMKGRSGVEPLKNLKVRQAIHHAIDVASINKLIVGNSVKLDRPPALCLRSQFGCDYSAKFLSYDPARAKKLLAEAGVDGGFDVKIVARPGQGKDIAVAAVNMLRNVGIKATLELHSFASYRKVQAAGKINMLVSGWGGGGIADVAGTLSFLFAPGSRDYHGNKAWIGLGRKANGEMDDAKRRAITKKLFDEVTEAAYIVPLVGIPRIWVHSKDVVMKDIGTPFFAYGAHPSFFSWK